MGTNYYAEVETCKACGKPRDEVHIGKSSFGWDFHFHATEECSSWNDWKRFLARDNVRIVDEYGDEHTLDAFKELIHRKHSDPNNMNPARVHQGEPLTEREKERVKMYAQRPYPRESRMYLDMEGYSMNPEEFS